jgi:predicted RNA-binding Zn ribbon-like protein
MLYSWSASDRFGLAVAPGGVALIQDFLNTKAIADFPDLLADPALARSWATDAVRAWSATRDHDVHPPALNAADVAKLRVLRATITGLMSEDTDDRPADARPALGFASASLGLSDTGEVRLEPAGRGWRWLASALWGEILLSQQTGSWGRLKQCHNPDCRSVFYDRSKNSSGVWHNVKTCGNAANLRASRARRRERTFDASADHPTSIESVSAHTHLAPNPREQSPSRG